MHKSTQSLQIPVFTGTGLIGFTPALCGAIQAIVEALDTPVKPEYDKGFLAMTMIVLSFLSLPDPCLRRDRLNQFGMVFVI